VSGWILVDPYGSVWSLGTPWGLPGASWGFLVPKKEGFRFLGVGDPPWALCVWILTNIALWHAYGFIVRVAMGPLGLTFGGVVV